MTNKEYYKEQIFEIACQGDSIAFDKKTNEMVGCDNLSCDDCEFGWLEGGCKKAISKWLEEEYKEPPVDWTKVEVDTPILVRDSRNKNEEWHKRYFAKYEGGKVYVFLGGRTSWNGEDEVCDWECAKLWKEE